jgi:hypothetical protein
LKIALVAISKKPISVIITPIKMLFAVMSATPEEIKPIAIANKLSVVIVFCIK